MPDPQETQQQDIGATGPATDLSTKDFPAGTTGVDDGVAHDVSGKPLGQAGAPAQKIDYLAEAAKMGGTPVPSKIDYLAEAAKMGGTPVPPETKQKSAPEQSHDLLTRALSWVMTKPPQDSSLASVAAQAKDNTSLAQAKNVSDYIYNNILGKDTYQHNNISYDEKPTTAWGNVKQRMWGWLTQDEVNKIPGLEPDRVQMLNEQGKDILGSIFGKEKADQLREHILNGSWVVNQQPEVFARAAAKSVTDFFSPGYYALGAFGRVAQGYQKAGQVAAAAQDWTKAASAMGKARLLGLIGSMGVNVPFAASQAHDLVENWDKMNVPERVAAVSGIVGASINAHIGINAAGGYKKVASDAATATGQAASVATQATKKAVGSMTSLGKAQDFNTAVERASDITKAGFADHRAKIQNVSPDLQAILNANPTVNSPQKFAKAIDDHIQSGEQALLAASGATQHDIAPVVSNLETRLDDHLDKFFSDNRGKFGTQDEVDAAKEDIKNRIMQQAGKNPDGSSILRAPNLFESENIRQGLNIDAAPQYRTDAKPTTNAYKAGAFEAAKVMREVIDEAYGNRGIDNVKERRQKEANLIDVRDRLAMAQQKAETMGNGGLWDALIKRFSVPTVITAIALGHNPLALGALAPYLAGDRVYQNVKNPNINVERAKKLAAPNASATELSFRPPTPSGQPPALGTPPAPGTPSTGGPVVPSPAPVAPPVAPVLPSHPSQDNPHPQAAPEPLPAPHVLADQAAAVAPATMEEPATNHALNAELATHFGEPLTHATLDDRVEHVKNDVEAMRKTGVALTPVQTKVLGAINEHEAAHTEAIEQTQKKSREDAYKVAEELHKMLAQEAAEEKKQKVEEAKKAKAAEPQEGLKNKQAAAASVLDHTEPEAKPIEYTDEEIPVPQQYKYVKPRNTRIHEAGHIVGSHAAGMAPLDIISHLHPEGDPDALAEARSSLDSLKYTDDQIKLGKDTLGFAIQRGQIDPAKVKAKLSELTVRALSGGMAEEIYGGVPFEGNKTTHGDLEGIRSILREYGELSDGEIERFIDMHKARTKKLLTSPGMSDIFNKYADKRIAGQDNSHHLNPALTAQMTGELDALGGKNARQSSGQGNEGNTRGAQKENTGTEGEGRGRGASDVPKTQQRAQGLVEKSTGDHDIDAVIRNGGGIPAGMQDFGEFGKIHMFHDPETGSTLGFKPSEKITPQNVGKKLAKSREDFAAGEKANAKREEAEKVLATKQAAEKEKKPMNLGEPAQAYDESKFPYSQPVKVTWPDGTVHEDEVKGLNSGHALARAKSNWEGAKVEPNGPGTKRTDMQTELAKTREQSRADRSHALSVDVEKAFNTKQAAEKEDSPVVKSLLEKYGETKDPLGTGFILSDGRRVNTGGADHATAVRVSTPLEERSPNKDRDLNDFINREKVVRTRYRTGRGGDEVVFSVPKEGLTEEHISQMRQAVGKMGRNGNAVMEVAEPDGASTQKDFVRPSDIDSMLREIGAHPEQKGDLESYTKPMPLPKALLEHPDWQASGMTEAGIHHHELAHGIIGKLEGFNQRGIISNRHPLAKKGVGRGTSIIAAASFDPPTQARSLATLPSFLDRAMAGAAANEALDNVPRDKNPGLIGDMANARRALSAAGFPESEHQALIDQSINRIKEKLTKPGVADIIREAGRTREDNLPVEFHHSENKVNYVTDKIRGILNGQQDNNTTGISGTRDQVNREPIAGREGEAPRANPSKAEKLKPFSPPKNTYEVEITDPQGNVRTESIQALNHKAAFKQVFAKGEDVRQVHIKSETKPTVGEPFETKQKSAVADAADEFNKEKGRDEIVPGTSHNPELAKRIADAYDKMPHSPNDPAVEKSYDSLKKDIDDQWDYAKDKMGIKFEPWKKDGQPYANSKEMVADVKNNKHLYFFQGGELPEDHPLTEQAGEGLSYNDKLRAVHDLFGHAAHEYQFGPKGEENAWNVHRQMFSPASIPAVTTETRGQNSWVNYGQHLRVPFKEGQTVPPERTTGNAATDAAIKQGGAIPGGFEKGDADAKVPDMAHFHDPTTGSTLVLSADQLTPEAVKQELAKSRQTYLKAKPEESRIPERGQPGYIPPTERPYAQNKAGLLPEEFHVPNNLNIDLDKHPAGGIDPRTGSMESKRYGLEIHPEDRMVLDHKPTAQDFQRYANEHADVLKQHPDMKLGWDTLGDKPELNIGVSTDDLDAAKKVGAKLDQRAIWDTKEQKEIPTGGKNTQREFPDYSLKSRLDDLSTKQSAGSWQPPADLEKGIPKDEAVETQIPLTKISVGERAYNQATSNYFRKRGSKTEGPISLVYNPDNGQYLVEDGMHRLVQAHQEGKTNIPAKIWSGHSDIANVLPEQKMDLSPIENEDEDNLSTKQKSDEDFEFGHNVADTADQQKGIISTAVPGGKNAIADPHTENVHVGMQSLTPETKEKIADKIRKMPGMRTPENITDPDKVIGRYINQFKENLKDLYNQVPKETRDATAKWYESANSIADKFASKYGKSTKQGAGVLAAMSPQKDWNMNVGLAERLTDIYHTKNNEPLSPEARVKAREIGLGGMVAAIGDKTLSQLTEPLEKAAFIRIYDEAHNDRSFQNVDPATGEYTNVMKNNDGSNSKIAWGALNEIAKAVNILDDGSRENISRNLGGSHKVRNFYNNIIDPNNPGGHVTIDTHAVAAGHQRPLSGKDPEVLDNFERLSALKTGLKGTYAVNAEAYRQAAKELGLQPRQLQSIVWEQVRKDFPMELKSNETHKAAIDDIWSQYKNGKITQKEAQGQVRDYAKTAREQIEANAEKPSTQQDFGFPILPSKFVNFKSKVGQEPALESGLDKLGGK
jgi:hypothetical protein